MKSFATNYNTNNMLLKTLSDYSRTGDIDDSILGLYTASQQYKKEHGVK